jgi:hypothetical protein
MKLLRAEVQMLRRELSDAATAQFESHRAQYLATEGKRNCRVLHEQARREMVKARILENALNMLGVHAPESIPLTPGSQA